MKQFFNSIALLFLLTGCEKKIEFPLKESAPKLVVEATIENDAYPFVILSRSLNYFSTITPDQLAGSFVRNAEIVISNGTLNHRLKEYNIPLPNGYALTYYTIDSANMATAFKGAPAQQYSLQILADGKSYSATTTIPAITRRIDSLWWEPVPKAATDTSEKSVTLMIKATDPRGYGDYIRYWTKRNRENFLPGFASVYDDLVIDGTTYEFAIDPGIDRNKDNPFNDDRFFKRGDTVTLKLSNIDKATYDFWRTMEYSYSSVGNPFSTPIKVLGNISNGALGYFGGYASQYRTIIIPR